MTKFMRSCLQNDQRKTCGKFQTSKYNDEHLLYFILKICVDVWILLNSSSHYEFEYTAVGLVTNMSEQTMQNR